VSTVWTDLLYFLKDHPYILVDYVFLAASASSVDELVEFFFEPRVSECVLCIDGRFTKSFAVRLKLLFRRVGECSGRAVHETRIRLWMTISNRIG